MRPIYGVMRWDMVFKAADFLNFKHMSLRTRLILIFSSILVLEIVFSLWLLVCQYRVTSYGGRTSLAAQVSFAHAVKVKEILNRINVRSERAVLTPKELDEDAGRVMGLIKNIRSHATSDTANELLDEVEKRSATYMARLHVANFGAGEGRLKAPRAGGGTRDTYNRPIQSTLEDALASIGAFLGFVQASVVQVTDQIMREQARALRVSVVILLTFIGLGIYICFQLVSAITSPLASFTRYLDRVNVEVLNLDSEVPRFKSRFPEMASVLRSFDQLMGRLREYKALNLGRLLVEKRRAEVIATSILDGIFLLRDDEILYMNPIAARILGMTHGTPCPAAKLSALAIVGAPGAAPGAVNEQYCPGGAKAVLSAISQSMPVEFTLERDSRSFYYLLQASPISYEMVKELAGESSIEPSAYDTVGRFAEELQANTLVLAQDVTFVKETQEAKSHFLATLSHEIKTPVTSLVMATRLLQRSVEQIPNPMHRSLISTCADDVDRLRGLLDDLLTVTRFDTLTQKMQIQYADLGKLVRHCVESFHADAAERGVSLRHHILNGDKPIIVPVDPTKITWALSNLLINGIRHTPKGGDVQAHLEARGDCAELRVRDTGPGIEKHRQEKIFDKFNSFYDLRVARSGRVGVGLAIAREIVAAHGGRIWVSSEPGHGAEFCFTLPLKRGASVGAETKTVGAEVAQTKGAESGTSSRG